MSNFAGMIPRLKGHEDFCDWKFAVQSYLRHEKLWKSVIGEDTSADNSEMALSKIILLLEPINYVHVKTAKTAKEAWDALSKAFDDSGLLRRVGLITKMINTKLDECAS